MDSKIKYLLPDLDGTLIQKQFAHYSWAKFVPEWIAEDIKMMLSNEGTVTNKERFLGYFCSRTGMSESEIWEIFLQYREYVRFQASSAIFRTDSESLGCDEQWIFDDGEWQGDSSGIRKNWYTCFFF